MYTGELINSKGVTATTSVTVVVNAANSAALVLSHDNWDGDGDFVMTADLWWGTNATSYQLFENDVAITSGSLAAASPAAQKVSVPITDRAVGSYTYRVVFASAAGSTSSAPVPVNVTR